jgi:hypothetical protein
VLNFSSLGAYSTQTDISDITISVEFCEKTFSLCPLATSVRGSCARPNGASIDEGDTILLSSSAASDDAPNDVPKFGEKTLTLLKLCSMDTQFD